MDDVFLVTGEDGVQYDVLKSTVGKRQTGPSQLYDKD
jgi:hypothetical protein